MNRILPQLLTFLTGKRRERVTDIKWSSTSWTHNVFRLYELISWRRAGIRFEGSTFDGLTVHGTWEHFFAHQEGRLRNFRNPFAFKLVRLPIFVLPDGTQLASNSIFNFAIAYDNSGEISTTSGTTISASFTVTGSNPIVLSWSGGGTGASSDVTSASYNSVALTLAKNVKIPSDRWWDCWYLLGPATGSHTLSVTGSSTNFWLGGLSYSGVAQSGQFDNTGTQTWLGSPNNFTITVSTANSWVVVLSSTRGFAWTGTTNLTSRLNVGDMQMGDSNGVVATGTFSGGFTQVDTADSQGAVILSIKPVAGTTYTPTYTEAITVTASLLKSTTRPLTESITAADTFLRSTLRSLTQSITVSDTLASLHTLLLTEAITLSVSGIFNRLFAYANILIVAGGGGASGNTGTGSGQGGGGGAGGLITDTHHPFMVGSYPVTVGTGGTGTSGQTLAGTNGNNSTLDGLTAIGGGAGGVFSANGAAGGSGGGGGNLGGGSATAGGAGTSGQGNAGGAGSPTGTNGGGGGGQSTTGFAYSAANSGQGGFGYTSSISGSTVTYSTGGNSGTNSNGTNAGDGGSSSPAGASHVGGNGADGIVFIAYPTGTIVATGGTITTSGGNTIHTFTANDSFIVTSTPLIAALVELITVTDTTLRSTLRSFSEALTASASAAVGRLKTFITLEAITASLSFSTKKNGTNVVWTHITKSANATWTKAAKRAATWTHISKSNQ